MIDAAKLADMRKSFDRLRQTAPHVHFDTDECSELLDTAIAYSAAVEAHNAAMVARCERQTGFCTHDPKHCIACPQRDLIDVPGMDAAGREG